MKLFRSFLISCFFAVPILTASNAQAASETECAIWVCLPGFFKSNSNCTQPFVRMIIRIATYRSPLPNFAGCIRSSELLDASGVTYNFERKIKRKRFSRKVRWARYNIDTFTDGVQTGGIEIKVSGKGKIQEFWNTHPYRQRVTPPSGTGHIEFDPAGGSPYVPPNPIPTNPPSIPITPPDAFIP